MNKIEEKLKNIIKRIPPKEIEQLRIILLKKWDKNRETAVIFPKLKFQTYPSLYFFGLVAEDWSGAGSSTLAAITASGWNIATHWGTSFFYERQKIGMVIIGIEIKNEQDFNKFLSDKNEIRSTLYEICFEGWRKRAMMIEDVKKIEKYEEVMKILKKVGKFNKGIAEEVTKFFMSRTQEYIEDRTGADLAETILNNHTFIQKIRRTGGKPQVKVKRLETKKEKLTGITIGCYEQDFSLLLALDAIREIIPDYSLKYNKQFTTDDKISIYRIEIEGFHLIKRIEKSIFNKLETMKFEKNGIKEVSRGTEQYGKAIIPKLIKEFTSTKIPQVYISPDITSEGFIHFKIITIKEVGSPWIELYTTNIDKLKGISILACETPKIYQDAEVSVFDLRAEIELFKSTEHIYTTIRNTLAEVIGNFRDFSEGIRNLDIQRFAEVGRKIKGVDITLLREFYYGIGDFYRTSGVEDEIIELVRLGVKLATGKVSDIKVNRFGDTCTLIGIASKENIMPMVLKMLETYETVVSKIQLGNLVFLLIRAEEQGKALPDEKLLHIIHTVGKILEVPGEKLSHSLTSV